nr:ATP nucleotide pyrophosphokinase [Streptomyces morookaense]
MEINRITTAALLTAALGLGPVTGAAAAPVEKPAKSVSLRPAEGGGGWEGDGLSLNAEDNRKVDDF